MRWLRFTHQGQPTLGLLQDGQVLLHRGLPWAAPEATGESVALADIPAGAWLPPVQPAQIIGLWNNFRAAAEKNGWAAPAEPLYFLKSPHCATGHGQPIPTAPAEVGRVAYEGELALVIGRPAWRIAREEAAACLFGCTVANDVTAMELLNRDTSFAQWSRAKSLPGFGALGPWIDTAFEPATATLHTRVGGRERQHYALADMFFPPEELVWRISQDLPLMPGDVILCGTSLGVLPMKPGTLVEVEIAGLGTLANTYG